MSPLDLTKDPELISGETTEITSNTEETVAVETTEVVVDEAAVNATEVETPSTNYNGYDKTQLTQALKELVEKNVDEVKEDVEVIKQLFYKKLKTEAEDLKKSFLESGGEESDFKAPKDELEEAFKNLINQFRGKKAQIAAQIEKEKEENLLQKQHIIIQMKSLVENNSDVSSHVSEFRALQQKWKSIGQVPASSATELWKQYNLYQEAFWDLIKINNELREYDFKKNLELKTSICEAAEKLTNLEDVVSAFQQLQKLHEEWHELGPVARELREQIWTRFKDASSIVNKKHQAHFDTIRKQEEDNYQLKLALCEKIEAFDYKDINNYKGWDEATETILAWQEEWRTIGFAPRKVNQKIFERYRTACDKFFDAKGEYYKAAKNVLNQNAELKKALCEKAEALKDSQEWKDTADKMIQLQKEWKTVGPVAKKHSDELWKRFISACDYFFDQKNKNSSDQKSVETENLNKKKELIAKIAGLEKGENNNETLTTLRALMAEWSTIGHVPFKEKDKIYKEYREVVDKQFESLNVDASNRRMESFKTNLKDMTSKGENKLYRERDKLVKAYEHLKSEIATYENNIGFFSSSSKKGGGLIKEMERKIEALKEESKLIEQKINLIDENL